MSYDVSILKIKDNNKKIIEHDTVILLYVLISIY